MASIVAGPTVQPPEWIERHERLLISIIVGLFALFATGFSLGPILEAPDEPSHYIYARNLILRKALPDPVAHINIQDHQAPLYYMLLVPATALVDDLATPLVLPDRNPFWGAAFDEVGNDNKNLRLHASNEDFPYSDSRIAFTVHLLRLISVLLGTLTVLVSYYSTRIVWPDRPDLRILSTSIVAFWPQFAWISGVLNNDNLLIALSSVSLYLTLRQLRNGPTTINAVVHGIVLGAALLTKASAAILALPVGIGVLLCRKSWKYALITASIAVLISGWWYARNITLMHTLAGWPPADDPGIIRQGQLAYDVALERLPFAYIGLWARFGNVSVPVSPAIYSFFDVISLIIPVGIVVWTIGQVRAVTNRVADRLKLSSRAVVLGFAVASFIGLLTVAATLYAGNQGRYLLMGITGWSMLISAGMLEWFTHRIRAQIALSAIAIWVTILAVCLFGFYYPAYQPTPYLGSVPAEPMFRFEQSVELLEVRPERIHGQPGETITISLTWRAIEPTQKSLITYLHTVDSGIVRRDSYPATGNLISTDWLPGQVWTENYRVVIPKVAAPQESFMLVAGLYDSDSKQRLSAFNQAGVAVLPAIGRIAVNSEPLAFENRYDLGGVILTDDPLVERTAGTINVCVDWFAAATMQTNYHVFIHVLGDGPNPIVQADFEPKQGRYPTSVWEPEEVIRDCVKLDASNVPVKQWRVAVGMYDVQTSERLPITDSSGNLLEGSMIVYDSSAPPKCCR